MSESKSQPADQVTEPKPEETSATEPEYQEEMHDVMADYLPTEQLDSRFAVIEEQFRKSFDERLGTQKPKKQFWEDESEMMRSSKILREASRGIGDEWQPIFNDLMAKFPPEDVEAERLKIEQQQPIIQGYKALTVWKEYMGASYTAMHLVDVLRKHNMDDLGDELLNILDNFDTESTNDAKAAKKDGKEDDKKDKDAKTKSDDKSKTVPKGVQRKKSDVTTKAKQGILDNRRLLLLAKKVGDDWVPLANALEIPKEEISEIQNGEDGKTYQGAFKALWAWRQTQPGNETEESRSILKAALEKVGKQNLLGELETK